jgi:HD superfamily phosphohydrolase
MCCCFGETIIFLHHNVSAMEKRISPLALELAPANGKIILDAVHGYIRIDLEYCEKFIDTPNFQRLKRIEQTNIRPLYPCAHHDRFIHSLGTYHLGRLVCHYLSINSGNFLEREFPTFQMLFEKLKKTFEIACLLHDVGHAPFSHTFERYFGSEKQQVNGVGEPIIDVMLSGKIPDKDNILHHDGKREEEFKLFCLNYKSKICSLKLQSSPKPQSSPKSHEKTSAILVLSTYFESINNFGVDPYLVARMIIGMPYSKDECQKKKEYRLTNLFIELLNGKTIDVDKLDYLARDQWACGRITKNVDYERLLTSLYIYPNDQGELVICYHKRAISEILALEQVKKAIHATIHTHHLIKYDTYVLKEAVEEIASKLNNSNSDEAMSKLIALQAIMKDKSIAVGTYKFRLLTDDDLIHIMKVHLDESQYAQEWFYRAYKLKPVWKTQADYNYFFKSREEQIVLHNNIEDIITTFFCAEGIENTPYHVEYELDDEYAPISTPDINILIKNKIVKLNSIIFVPAQSSSTEEAVPCREKSQLPKENRDPFFLLYIPKKILKTKRDSLIEHFREKIQEKIKLAKEPAKQP